jgi:hypothetical protein
LRLAAGFLLGLVITDAVQLRWLCTRCNLAFLAYSFRCTTEDV